MEIHDQIQSGRFPTAPKLACDLSVTLRTIRRDEEFMKSRCNLPIEYHPIKNGYYYTRRRGDACSLLATAEADRVRQS
jgi:predicted DNA-binding transcriptional regulator YafY